MAVLTPTFPTSLDTLTTLGRVVNFATTTVGVGGVDSTANTVPITDTSAWPSDGVCVIGTEAISYTGKTGSSITGCARGFDNTSQAAHAAGDPAYGGIVISAHYKALRDAIIAIETVLGANGANVLGTGGGTLTGALTIDQAGDYGTLKLDGATEGGSLEFYKNADLQALIYTNDAYELILSTVGSSIVCLNDLKVPDEAYDATAWNGSLEVPTKNAIRDKIEAIPALTDGDKGDITVSSSGAVWTVDNDAITYAKIQNVSATDKVLGRSTAGAGDVEEITLTATGRSIIDDTSVSAVRTTLGLGTIATQNANAVALTDGTITAALTDKGGQVYNASAYASIQAAIDAASAAGGGTVLVVVDTNVATSITLKTDVVVKVNPGVTLTWTGAAGGTMFTTDPTDPTQRFGYVGGIIHPGGATNGADIIFDLHSPQVCEFGNIRIQQGRATTKVLKIQADCTNASGYSLTRQAVFGTYHDITVEEKCGTVIELEGQGVPLGGVTLNEFRNFEGRDVNVAAIRIVEWSDNNIFTGYHRYSLLGNNAIGLLVNDSATPTVDVGIYAITFQALAIDTFVGRTGRIGIKLNACKRITVNGYHNDPIAEGGVFVDNGASSYQIQNVGRSGGSVIDLYEKGIVRMPGGMLPDYKETSDGAMTSGSAVLTSATIGFNPYDVGKLMVVTGAGVAGDRLRTTIAGYTSATQVTLANAASTTVSAATIGYASDSQPALQAHINALSASGGGDIVLDGGVFGIDSTITLKSGVMIYLAPGTAIKWFGIAGAGAMFTTSLTAPTQRCGVFGNGGSSIRPSGEAAIVFDLHSVQQSVFGGFEVWGGDASTIVYKLRSDVSSTTGGYSNTRNTAFNRFLRTICSGTVGTIVDAAGSDGWGGVTLNQFEGLEGNNVVSRGVVLRHWVDSNQFLGFNRFDLQGNNAIGFSVNESAQVIIGATITNGGTGYTTAPAVGFSGGGGTGAAATAVVSGGVVTKVMMTDAGSGYTSAPTIAFTGGGGASAAATAVVGGPTVDAAVYGNQFSHLAVDTFVGLTGRIGIQLNQSKGNIVQQFHNDPNAEGGAFVGTNAASYYVMRTGTGGTGTQTVYAKGLRQGLGTTAPTATLHVFNTLATDEALIRASGVATISANDNKVVDIVPSLVPSAAIAGNTYAFAVTPSFPSQAAGNNMGNVAAIMGRVDTVSGWAPSIGAAIGVWLPAHIKGGAGAIGQTYGALVMNQTVGTNNANIAVGGVAAAGNWSIYSASSYDSALVGQLRVGSATAPDANLALGAGTATAGTAPLKFVAGTLLTTPEAGVMEYAGDLLSFTKDTTNGRGGILVEHRVKLDANGSTINTIANFFGATSNLPLVANAYYEIDIEAWFLKTTAGTVTWTFTNTAAPTQMNLDYALSPVGGIVSTAAATMLEGQQHNLTATAPTIATGSLTTVTTHYHKIKIQLRNGTGTSLKFQVTASAGTLTPLAGSRWRARRIDDTNVGALAA